MSAAGTVPALDEWWRRMEVLMPQTDSRTAYVALRSRDTSLLSRVASQRAETERKLAECDVALARLQPGEVQRKLGILFAYARVRADVHYELAELARQPWFISLTCPLEGGLLLIARLQRGELLRLRLTWNNVPAVRVLPAASPRPLSAVDQAALDLLLAGGRLVDLVILAARRLGLQLDDEPAHCGEPVKADADRQYFRQRAAWLTQAAGGGEAEALLAQMADLERKLFILDELQQNLARESGDPARVSAFAREWECLCSLPHVASLSVRGDQVVMVTDAITIQGICVGSFCVTFDFAIAHMEIVNQTKPISNDGGTRYDHPHVRDGRACAGTAQGPLAAFLASRDVPKLIDLTLDFLQSYNPSSPYRSLDAWA